MFLNTGRLGSFTSIQVPAHALLCSVIPSEQNYVPKNAKYLANSAEEPRR